MTDAEFTNWPKTLQFPLRKQNPPHMKMQKLKQSYSLNDKI